MNNRYGFGRILFSIIVAMCLRIAPWPAELALYNPDWVLMVLVYWSITYPERVGIFHAWTFGLFADVLTGRLLGQYALAYSLVIYICLKLHKRLRRFPWVQQELFVFCCLLLSQLLLFLIKNLRHPAQLHGDFWWPVLTGTLCWPIVHLALRFVRLSKPVK